MIITFWKILKVGGQVEDKGRCRQKYLWVLDNQISEEKTTLHFGKFKSTQYDHFVPKKHLGK